MTLMAWPATTRLLALAGVVAVAGCTGQATVPSPATSPPTAPTATSAMPTSPATQGPLATPNTTVSSAEPVASWPDTIQASSAPGYFRYANKRFSFSFDVPDGYTAAWPPVDGDGREFDNARHTASIVGFGSNNSTLGTSPAQDLAGLISSHRSHGDTVTYQVMSGDIVAVSGTTPRGAIFYQRDVVYPQVIYSLVWTYPAAEKAQFNALVTHTVDTFTPGPDRTG